MKLAIPVNLTTASVMLVSLAVLIFFTTKDSVPEDADIVIKMRDDDRAIQTLEDLEAEVMEQPEEIVKVALAGWHQVLVLPFQRKPSEREPVTLGFGKDEIVFNGGKVSKSELKSKLKDLNMAVEAVEQKGEILLEFADKPTPLDQVFKKLRPSWKGRDGLIIVTLEK